MLGPGQLEEARDLAVGSDQADVEVVAVFGDVDVARLDGDRDVVHRSQRCAGDRVGVVEDLDLLGHGVVGPHAVVRCGRHVDDVRVEPDPLAAAELRCRGHLLARRRAGRKRVRDLLPRDFAALGGVNDGDLERALGQVGIRLGCEAVEARIAEVLGQVQPFADGIGADRLVLEDPHRRALDGWLATVGIALPDGSLLVLLAGEPRSPRRRAARAVCLRAGEDPIGAFDLPLVVEADRGSAAGAGQRHLGVGHQDPAVVLRRICGLTIGEEVPRIARVLHRDQATRDLPRAEAGGQHQPIGVGRPQRTVGPRAGLGRRCGEGFTPEGGTERERPGADETAAYEAPARLSPTAHPVNGTTPGTLVVKVG